jgi:23S rRNA pseudouridine1911/1915/1917 synthase
VTPPPQRLDLALIALHPGLSRRRAQAAIEKGQVTVDDLVVLEPGRRLGPDAQIRWDANRPAVKRVRLALPVLYQDEHVIVIDKPSGLLSVPTDTGDPEGTDTALGQVLTATRAAHPRAFVGRVHRLDRDTSGALCFALSSAARAGLIELFSRHDIERVYLALVSGAPRASQGTVDAPIRDTYTSGRRGIAAPHEAGSHARTHWRLVERLDGASLLEVRLETGRQHQIRAHLAHIDLPVIGDRVYGNGPQAPRRLVAPRIMLHAWRLGFRHPISETRIAVESPLPEDFQTLLARLRR